MEAAGALAEALQAAGDNAGAGVVLRKTLEMLEAARGKEDIETRAMAGRLITALEDAGMDAEAMDVEDNYDV